MVVKAGSDQVHAIARLALRLWPEHTYEELSKEIDLLLASPSAAVFVWREGAASVGFAQCQLRFDYVEGTHSSPVGYLEGVYVDPTYRRGGVAKALLTACENWAKEQGCTEFASDCEIHNADSYGFHTHNGFAEAGRIICLRKALK